MLNRLFLGNGRFSYFLYQWKSKKIFIAYLSSIRTAERPQTFYRLRLLFYLAFGRSVFSKSTDYTPPTALLTIRQFSRLCSQFLFLRFYAPLQLFKYLPQAADSPAECHAVQAYRAQSDHSASVHTQEQPPYRHELDVPCKYAADAKVYGIDDETHSTMLLASEY